MEVFLVTFLVLSSKLEDAIGPSGAELCYETATNVPVSLKKKKKKKNKNDLSSTVEGSLKYQTRNSKSC